MQQPKIQQLALDITAAVDKRLRLMDLQIFMEVFVRVPSQ